jgi:broad specificity phosphatase PhoE
LIETLPNIYLVRHGETEWSKSGRHTGRTDLPLTPNGEAQARALRARLADTTFDHILTSPLQRAARTAELAGFAATPDPDLMEWDYGHYEGLTSSTIRAHHPGWDLFEDGCPGGESVGQIAQRVDRIATRLKGLSGNVLFFAHGHLLRVLAARWVGQPVPFARALLLSTGSVSALGFGHHSVDEPAISLWNS